ncbi:MAG: hypothetical protein FWJ90_23750 [Actinomadura sp.]
MTMTKNTAQRKGMARSFTVLGVAGATAAGFILGAVPAHAARMQPAVFADRVEFLGNENNHDVSGAMKFSIRPDGTWSIFSNTRNGRPAFRHVYWTCIVTIQDDTTTTKTRVDTPSVKIERKSNHTFDVSGVSTSFATNYNAIIDPGLTVVDCDIHFGK